MRFHSLETWLFRARDGRMLAHTRQMADFGDAVPNCPGADPRGAWRLLPAPGCRSGYEEWDTALDVGGVFGARPGFGHPRRDHAVRPSEPRRGRSSTSMTAERPGGVEVPLQGRPPQRAAPALAHAQHGLARASAPTRTAAAPPPASFRSCRATCASTSGASADGVENAFIAEQPSDGGIYRAGRGLRPRRGFEFPGLLRDPHELTYAACVQLIHPERRPTRPRSWRRGLGLRELAPPGRPYLGINMVSSLDGKATLDWRTKGLSSDVDRRSSSTTCARRRTP